MRPASGESPEEPRLLTPRLELWMPQVNDLHPLYQIVSDVETARFLGGQSTLPDHFMRFTRNAGSWHLYGYGMFMVRKRGDDRTLLGNCGIFHSLRGLGEDFDDRPEAGWIIRRDSIGKGYAGEAMCTILEWWDKAFGRELVCLIVLGNTPSLSLAERLGFQPMRETELPDGSQVLLLRRPRVS